MKARSFRRVSFVLVLALLLSNAVIGVASAEPPAGIAAGEILVKFQPGTPGQAAAEAHRQNGGQVQETIPGIDVQVVRVPAGQEQARADAYARNPNVLFAEVNGSYEAIGKPADKPGKGGSTSPPAEGQDPLLDQQWQYPKIKATDAWQVTGGSSSVAIAILDTGIDQSHEDLKAKIKQNKNFTNSKSVDDKYGHGTHVAGSAAAVTNNALGVAGTCPNCVLHNVKVLNDSGSGQWSWIASGITWAADNGARVINMSLGGSVGSSTVEAAINYAWGKGVVVVAAAGNSGTSSPSYPAYYEKVIAVAATDRNDAKASWSNYGASWVDVAAPGVSILSTAPDHSNRIWGSGVKYGTISGTSMASPHVAGLAGLLSSDTCGAACVRGKIENKADAITGTGSLWAKGRINAYRALTE